MVLRRLIIFAVIECFFIELSGHLGCTGMRNPVRNTWYEYPTKVQILGLYVPSEPKKRYILLFPISSLNVNFQNSFASGLISKHVMKWY